MLRAFCLIISLSAAWFLHGRRDLSYLTPELIKFVCIIQLGILETPSGCQIQHDNLIIIKIRTSNDVSVSQAG